MGATLYNYERILNINLDLKNVTSKLNNTSLMNLSVFLKHQWLSFWRARNANKSLAIQIILGVFYFLIFLNFFLQL